MKSSLAIAFKFAFLFLLGIAFASAAAAFGQAGRGAVSGSVTDPSGAIVPGASVKLLDTANGVSRTALTNDAGLYSFISLNPGTYQITASKPGFATLVREGIAVNVDQTTVVNLALRIGQVTQVVRVIHSQELVSPSYRSVPQRSRTFHSESNRPGEQPR